MSKHYKLPNVVLAENGLLGPTTFQQFENETLHENEVLYIGKPNVRRNKEK
jgi:hypothetical protein